MPVASSPLSPAPLSFSLLETIITSLLSCLILFFKDKSIKQHPKITSVLSGCNRRGGGRRLWRDTSSSGGKEGGGGSDKVHALFACHKKSSVIRYLNPNQQFHIRNPSRMFLHLIAVPLSFCTDLGDTRFVLSDGNRWAFIVKPRLYANVNLVSPDPEA